MFTTVCDSQCLDLTVYRNASVIQSYVVFPKADKTLL